MDLSEKMFDLVEDYGELIEGLSKTFDSLQANKTNEIMRVLTYFSTIMLPLTVVTGMYGMNVNLPFQTEGWAFWGIVGLMVTITVVLLVFFQRRLR